MSFIDLATLAFHRRNEMEVRIKTFIDKCDQSISNIEKLKMQAHGFVQRLNCDTSELRERFLQCLKQLDEYTYIITDFNLAVECLGPTVEFEDNSSDAPVHDISHTNTPCHQTAVNIVDMLSDQSPSASLACANSCPTKKPQHITVPKEDQMLIAFSSSSCSSESVPENKIAKMVEKEIQCKITEIEKEVPQITGEMSGMKINDPPAVPESCNLPPQSMLQVDRCYPGAILHIDGETFWILTDDVSEPVRLGEELTKYYNNLANHVKLSTEEAAALTYCACFDQDTDFYYRGLLIHLTGENKEIAEVFLVDTGEVRCTSTERLQPLAPQFCDKAPYVRCCHLSGVDLLSYHNKDLMQKQVEFMKQFIGVHCIIEVDDNTSESLGVFVRLPSKKTLNEMLVQEGLAISTDKPTDMPHVTQPEEVTKDSHNTLIEGPPELVNDDIDITECPEYEDPVEAIMGYQNRDEVDICKHYKGGPNKTCFKGKRCQKKHILHNPDGWTRDQVEVPVKVKCLPLPAPDTWHKLYVTHVCHFDRLYVQFAKEKDKTEELPSFGVVLPPLTLTSLVRDMNSPAARLAYKPLKMNPAPGELVAALYPLDNQWYRARVQSLTRADQNVEVLYIDYGNLVWVKEDSVRVLDKRFLSLPAQTIRCKLAGVLPLTSCSRQWAAAKKALADMVQGRTLDVHVIARGYDEITVEMYDEDGYSIAEQLAVKQMINLCEYKVDDDTNQTFKHVVP